MSRRASRPRRATRLEGAERQPGAAQLERRAEIAEGGRPGRRRQREAEAGIGLRPQQPAGRQAQCRVALARGGAQIDHVVGPAAPEAPTQKTAGQQGVGERQEQQAPFGHEAGQAEAQQLGQAQPGARHDEADGAGQAQRPHPGQRPGTGDEENALGRVRGQGLAQRGRRAATLDQSFCRDHRHAERVRGVRRRR